MQNNMNVSWLNEKIRENCEMKALTDTKEDINMCSEAYQLVFNGAPFYEDWTLESARNVILEYLNEKAIIYTPVLENKILGFLVAMRGVPSNQKEYVPYKDSETMFIEEIGVLNKYRHLGIASELVRNLLLYEFQKERYFIFRTNAMRYFKPMEEETFLEGMRRVQELDRLYRSQGKQIPFLEFNENEKQQFINEYLKIVKQYPELDVSNSNALFRDIFGEISFCQMGENYSFQHDPSGVGNDRIFTVVDMRRNPILSRRK